MAKHALRRSLSVLLLVALVLLAFSAGNRLSPSPASALAASSDAGFFGQISLQGCPSHGGILVSAGSQSTTTRHDGVFIMPGVGPGTHAVEASRPGVLSLRTGVLELAPGEVVYLADATLPGGDANSDGFIDLQDLLRMAAAFGQAPLPGAHTDLNGDGWVDISDISILAVSYGRTGPVAWPLRSRIMTIPTSTPTLPATPTVRPTPTPTETPRADPYKLRVWVDNAEPSQFTVAQVFVQLTFGGVGIPGAIVEVTWRFDSGDVRCTETTGGNGVSACAHNIGGATPGRPVPIDIDVIFAGETYRASTSITPR